MPTLKTISEVKEQFHSKLANGICHFVYKKKDGTFSAEVNLPKETKHEFKYLVNATDWVNEPGADEEQPNAFGGSNSVIVL